MAKELGDLIVRLSLDSTKFDDGVKRLETGMLKIQADFKSSATGLTNFDKVTEKLRGSADTLTERLNLQREKVKQLQSAYEESKRTKGEDAEETQKLAAKLEEARGKLEQTEKALAAVNEQIRLNENGWYKLGVNLEGVGSKLQEIGGKISAVGTSMSAKVTAPVVALGAACVKTFTGFDDAMRQVQATMAGTEEDLQKLTAAAKKMGAETAFTASDAANALNYLALAGYDADQAIEALPNVLSLASAGGLDLAYASDLVTDNMSALGLEMQDLTGFTDQMAKTSQKSNTNIAQLGEAILTVGGTAKNLAGGTVELNTVLGILADNGIKGAEGGTALRNMILSLSAPTDTAAKAMKKLGLDVFDAQGNMRPLNEVFRDLNGTLGTMTQEKRTEILSTIFNKVDLKAATALLANCGGRFDELSGYISNCDGAAQLMAETMEGGIGGSFRELESAIEGLAIAFGERLAPYIKAIAEKLTELTTKFINLSPETQDLIIKIAAIAAAIGPALVVFGKLTAGLGSIMKFIAPLAKALGGAKVATGGFGAALTALSGPVGWVVAAIAGLAAVFVVLWNTNDEFRANMIQTWETIKAALIPIKDMFVSTFQRMVESFAPLKESLGKLWETVQEVALKLWNALEPVLTSLGVLIGATVAIILSAVNGIMLALAPLVDAVIGAVDFVLNILGALMDFLSGDFSGAWESLKAAFSSLWDVVVNVFSAIGAFLSGFWESLCTICAGFGIDLNAVFSGIWEGIKTGAAAIWSGFTSWLSGVWQGICGTASAIWNGLLTFFSGLWMGITSGATEAWSNFSAWLTGIWSGICGAASAIWNGLLTFFSGLWTSISTGASAAWQGISSTITGLWDGLKTAATTAWNAICTNVSNAVNTGKTLISTAWENVKSAVSGVWDTIKTGASTAWQTICANVQSAVSGAQIGIQAAWSNISTGVTTVWNNLKNTVSGIWSGITGGVKSAIEGGKNGIVSAWDAVRSGVKSTWDKVPDVVKSPITSAQNWIQEKVSFFKGLFNFQWKLPSFKLPKVSVSWREIGWGIKVPSLSLTWNALGAIFRKPTIFNTAQGLQGVGEAGPEAVLPLNTLWGEMSTRLKSGMAEIMRDAQLMDGQQLGAAVRAAVLEGISTLPASGEQTMTGASGPVNLTLEIDGKALARLLLPSLDVEQAAAWNRNLRLAGV